MSGRVKHPVTDAEQLRQLTREAHEAIQGLLEAKRDLRQARDEHVAAIDEAVRQAVTDAGDILAKSAAGLVAYVDAQVQKVTSHMGDLLGTSTGRQLGDVIANQCAVELARQLIVDVENGRPVIRKRERPPPAQVTVTTDPAMAPPGSIVIDARGDRGD